MGADMQSLYDHRIWKGKLGFGPFANEKDFNLFLRNGIDAGSDYLDDVKATFPAKYHSTLKMLIDMQEAKRHRICFTHGDASSSNILVRGGKVVALIDFELSGFYPEYWEYTRAMNVNRSDNFWKAEVVKFLKAYPKEWEMEQIRLKLFGRQGTNL